ncbi:hypothetical protein K9L05_02075, partial [Candidatus Babeliales bacterium]|nr:hypothetical protein [Candidatus Babeliales bacterium]
MSKNFIIKSFVGLLFLVSCLNANPPRNSTPSPPPPIQVSLPSNYNDDSTYNDDALTETALFTPSSFKQTSTSDFLAAYMDPEKSLPIINLSQYQYLTDDDLINIAKVHTLSEYLDISGCYQITDAGIEGLSQYC